MTALGEPRRVLVSADVAATLSDVFVRPRSAGPPLEIVTLDEARDDPSIEVQAAFISRDITGPSSKTQLSDAVLATYAVLRRSPALRWVHTHSAGADRPIYAELRARGVAVTTSAGANAAVVAQTALAAVLALARRLPQQWQAQRERRWAPLAAEASALPAELAGQTAVLVGWGPIARTLRPWLAMVGLHVVVVRREAEAAGPGIETLRHDALAEALPRADWLILACPLNAQTRGLVDEAAFARLKPGARLVNVARGEVVDEAALIEALCTGRLGGAWLDVFETEPLPAESPLWTHPQVVVTPHSAGHGAGNATRVAAIFVENLDRWQRGQPLLNLIN